MAVSHYQVEGNDPCDWTDWGRAVGPCGDAVDSWTRYEEDALLAHRAGANSFRFSVSWSRVEPKRGQFDYAALERYRRFVDRLVAYGLEPIEAIERMELNVVDPGGHTRRPQEGGGRGRHDHEGQDGRVSGDASHAHPT